jgi:hypothetical protein
MYKCNACNKQYTSSYNLKLHLKRQPLCVEWNELNPTLKEYIDDKFGPLPMTDEDKKKIDTHCFICNTTFANIGNLNRHLENNTICRKWSMYKDLEPLSTYIENKVMASGIEMFNIDDLGSSRDNACHTYLGMHYDYEPFEYPKYSICHIIWNVYLVDKIMVSKPDFEQIVRENDIRYMIAILPDLPDSNVPFDIDHSVMVYKGHDMEIDTKMFETQCNTIEEYRKKRENIVVYCNSGYQRSIPFLCYYLVKHHGDEVPTIERAIDIILPRIDQGNYDVLRKGMIKHIKLLLGPIGLQ